MIKIYCKGCKSYNKYLFLIRMRDFLECKGERVVSINPLGDKKIKYKKIPVIKNKDCNCTDYSLIIFKRLKNLFTKAVGSK